MRFIALLALLPWYAWGIALNSTQDADAAFSVAFDTAVDPIRRVSFTANFGTNDPLKRGEAFSVTLYDGNGALIGSGAYENTSPGTVLGCACIDIDGTVNTSSMTARISNTVGTQELSSVTVEVAGRLNTERKTATLSAYTEPVDPNDPVDPPPNPGDYPEPVVTYQPAFRPLGSYSVAGVCQEVHGAGANKVTLADGETLESAWTRLRNTAGYVKAEGGVIEIPYNVDTVQCDQLWLRENAIMNSAKLTLRGVPGPDGEQPRFYCRWQVPTIPTGTIPNEAKQTGYFLQLGASMHDHPTVLVENIHIDGYGGAFSLPSTGTYIFRRNYAHHGPDNGFIQHGTGDPWIRDWQFGSDLFKEDASFEMEVCDNEISWYGGGNAEHNFYMHASFGYTGLTPSGMGGYPGTAKITLVDNFIHTSNYGSCYKSIVENNVIINNVFSHKEFTDPSYDIAGETENKRCNMLVDVPACSTSVIRGNTFRFYDGSYAIGVRNRRLPHRGCDKPVMWSPKTWVHPDTGEKIEWPFPVFESEASAAASAVTQTANGIYATNSQATGNMHSDAWWTSLAGEKFFQILVEDNTFEMHPDAEVTADRAQLVESGGTYPNFESGFGGNDCFLPTPSTWYERSVVVMRDNTYEAGMVPEKNYNITDEMPLHNITGKCQNVPNNPYIIGDGTTYDGPGPATSVSDLFEIGTGEMYGGEEYTP